MAALGRGQRRGTWPYGRAAAVGAVALDLARVGRRRCRPRSSRPAYLGPALADAASFTPHLLIAGGPENGWNPDARRRTQIAYGADSRLQSLLAVAARTAPACGGWRASPPRGTSATTRPRRRCTTRRPAVTFDGVARDGTINRNSGAESTIHGLLSMLALDAAPDVAARARVAGARAAHDPTRDRGRGRDALRRRPSSSRRTAWTGESAWSGARYAELPPGGEVAFGAVATEPSLIEAVALRSEGAGGGATRWGTLGTLEHSNAGPQGASPAPGVLEVQRLCELAPGEPLTAGQAGDGTTALDAVQVQPLVETLTLRGGPRAQALLRSFDDARRRVAVELPGSGEATAASYDARGRLVGRARTRGARIEVTVAPGGFTIAER